MTARSTGISRGIDFIGDVVNKITISEFRAVEKNTLRGFFTATLAGGLIIHNLSLHERNDGRWIGMPSEKFTDREGKTGYKKLIEFTDRAALDAFRDACLKGIDGLNVSDQSSPASQTDTPNPWNAQPMAQQSRPAQAPNQNRSRSANGSQTSQRSTSAEAVPASSYQASDDDIPF